MSKPIEADRQQRFIDATSSAQEAATMDELCLRVAEGDSLTAVCKAWDVPRGRIAAWLASEPKRRSAYEAAQELHADALMSETVAIADEQAVAFSKSGEPFDPDVTRDRLRVDTRMKVASKLYRARFGESVQHTGKKDEPIVVLTIAPGDDSVI